MPATREPNMPEESLENAPKHASHVAEESDPPPTECKPFYILQRGLQWKQGAVTFPHMITCCFVTKYRPHPLQPPSHCTPLCRISSHAFGQGADSSRSCPRWAPRGPLTPFHARPPLRSWVACYLCGPFPDHVFRFAWPFCVLFGPLVAGSGLSSNNYAEFSYRGLICPCFRKHPGQKIKPCCSNTVVSMHSTDMQ